LTSISEAQPLALLEAAATGLPVVTTDVGSCREIIEGFEGDSVVGRGGFVVEPCNPKATAQALADILLDHAMRAEMGRVMLQRIPNLYHKDRIRRLGRLDFAYRVIPGISSVQQLAAADRRSRDKVVGLVRPASPGPIRLTPSSESVMSGINITIERMTRQPALTSIVAISQRAGGGSGLYHAGIVDAAPPAARL
jgi:hypothetical protein